MSDSKVAKFMFILSGLGVVVVGLVGVGIGVLAIIDPAGAKQSDDSDPFGPPVSRLWSAAIALFFAFVSAFGFWIVSLSTKDRKTE